MYLLRLGVNRLAIVIAQAGQHTKYTQRRGSNGADDDIDDDKQTKPKSKPVNGS